MPKYAVATKKGIDAQMRKSDSSKAGKYLMINLDVIDIITTKI
ncbi:hypothetical protein EV11_2004 [Prochlorococcus sp. SS52]|nr:hypothetical protein EV04_0690 [Prochlorococcus marinus str. LG]KGG22479.1 hypothetical protein EV08_0120 [Prochlorococcus marinus str. SS2]KGG23778.1 hypothetical protein EV09_0880 [Prochlorococcus marinus str. SS35]KGG32009.1 hypothetical protein EV10_1123 [Prochlorococcus marinus str. SS51]KGG34461.1 hypothetical protein EV11_2004 [Prochlorococcus sp. SS52]